MVPTSKLSERAVIKPYDKDNVTRVAGSISIVLLILNATTSKDANESCSDEYTQWISIAMNLVTPLTSLKKILDGLSIFFLKRRN